MSEVEAELGPIDILVNNAGVNKRGAVEELTEADWDMVIDTNLKGPWLCARAVGPKMRDRGWGRIINLASVLGVIALPGRSPYASSKAGVINLTRVLALEWAGTGVTANAICPGAFGTEMNRVAAGRSREVSGVRAAHSDEAVGRSRGDCRRRRVSRVGRGVVRHRQHADRRRRLDRH